jgi:predicted dinucleotide-binding enzyme
VHQIIKPLGRPIIKAFNNIRAQHLMDMGTPRGQARIALPVAGDDRAAKDMVMGIIGELGFNSVDTGDLHSSWRQQPGTPVYGTDLDEVGVQQALANASEQRQQEWCAAQE